MRQNDESPQVVVCPYCGKNAELVDSAEIYNGNSYGPTWLCRPCDAYVGCHPRTNQPLGSLANKELRRWRMQAHAVFDAMWKAKVKHTGCTKGYARRRAYRWLRQQLKLSRKKCHIGMFDVDTCKKVIELCSR